MGYPSKKKKNLFEETQLKSTNNNDNNDQDSYTERLYQETTIKTVLHRGQVLNNIFI